MVERLRKTFEAHRGSAELFIEVAHPGAYRLVARAEARGFDTGQLQRTLQGPAD